MSVFFLLPFSFFRRFFSGHLKIRDILDHFFDIIHGVRDSLFLCRIHDLLHALRKLFLEVHGIELFRIRFYPRNLHGLRHDLTGGEVFILTHLHDTFPLDLFSCDIAVLLLLLRSERLIQHF